MRRSVPAACLVVLAVLAGCSVFGGSSTPTPAASPSATAPSAGTPADVPGVEDGRLADAGTLLSAHERELLRTGFESDYRANRTKVTRGQVVTFVGRQRTVVEPNRTEYRYRVTSGVGRPTSRFDTWGNRSVRAVRGRVGNATRYSTGPPADASQLTGRPVLSTYLRASTYEVVDSGRRDGRYLVTLAATDANASRVLPPNGTDLRNYESRVVVDGQGRVLRFRATGNYTVAAGGTREPGVLDVRYVIVRLDSGDLERPDWVAEALSG